MLWRVRTTLADRPGALAALARRCGEQSVNILALQIFPGVEGVTDELVLRSPAGWGLGDVAALVEGAGGTAVRVGTCTEHALVDGPTRYLHALRSVVAGDEPLPAVLAGLVGATAVTPHPAADDDLLAAVQDALVVGLAGERVELRRTTPFTATEHARATAFAELVEDLLEQGLVAPRPLVAEPVAGGAPLTVRLATVADADALTRMHGRCSTDTLSRHFGAPLARLDGRLARRLLTGGTGAVAAASGDEVVGLVRVGAVVDGGCDMSLLVEDGRQRQGIGTRLLAAGARLAAGAGAHDVVMRGPADSPSAIAMVFGSGLRARVKLTGDDLVVTISTRGLAPLPTPGAPAAPAAPAVAGRRATRPAG